MGPGATVGGVKESEIRRRKRRSNKAVLGGVVSMVMAVLVDLTELAPPLATTVVALVGLALLMYGVQIGWLVFYDRDTDGPSS